MGACESKEAARKSYSPNQFSRTRNGICIFSSWLIYYWPVVHKKRSVKLFTVITIIFLKWTGGASPYWSYINNSKGIFTNQQKEKGKKDKQKKTISEKTMEDSLVILAFVLNTSFHSIDNHDQLILELLLASFSHRQTRTNKISNDVNKIWCMCMLIS
jgi:hypothetical protein